MTLRLIAEAADAGARLDAFVASRANGLTRSQAARYIDEGRVFVDGKPAAKSCRLTGGETVTVEVPEVRDTAVEPQDIPLDVVYEDGDVIVVNKPAGLVVHPAPGHPDGTLVNALLHHCGASLSGIGGEKRPGIVHRIDRDTSGLIIAAKNDAAHLGLSAQLSGHTLARTYECLVVGNLKEDSGTVDAPIGRHPSDRKRMAVVAGGGARRDPLGGHRPVSGGHACAVPARDGAHPPDPGTHGLYRPPHSGGYGVRREEAGAGADGSVPPRGGAAVHPPPHRTAGGAALSAAGGVPAAAAEAGK